MGEWGPGEEVLAPSVRNAELPGWPLLAQHDRFVFTFGLSRVKS